MERFESVLEHEGHGYRFLSMNKLGEVVQDVARLPKSLKALLMRACSLVQDEEGVVALAKGFLSRQGTFDYVPARLLLQDFTGVPLVVDLAAMRQVLAGRGVDPAAVTPRIRADLVVDHSVQVDFFGSPDALTRNVRREFERNRERYTLLRWAEDNLDNLRVVPPGRGICHQVNLEYLSTVVHFQSMEGGRRVTWDTVMGTDSHTAMVGGIGVLAWGVGGIEAEAVMLGVPVAMPVPEVVGVRLKGRLRPGVTATDLVLTVTQRLRSHGVVGNFVEFFGEALSGLSVPDRATVANMAPEYGATVSYFPVDKRTLEYLRETGRPESLARAVERFATVQGMVANRGTPPDFDEVIELDLGQVEASVSGPSRPQDRVFLSSVPEVVEAATGVGRETGTRNSASVVVGGQQVHVEDGAVAIAAITSCTNTSNPRLMVMAGLVARNARRKGLRPPPWVKTSLAPGSRVVTRYLRQAGLLRDLEALGFSLVGYGCTTCIGNSGPLPQGMQEAAKQGVYLTAVLSGNRNFEGRINPHVRGSFLCSPPLVVAYALAGSVMVDLMNEPLGKDSKGENVFLHDLWPSEGEVDRIVRSTLSRTQFSEEYADIFGGTEEWDSLGSSQGLLFHWDPGSTYIRFPPFFDSLDDRRDLGVWLKGLRVLAMLGDSVTTDHISPAGAIPPESPAGRYLLEHGVAVEGFNTYGSRRGNHEVMVRGTFANSRLRNFLVPGVEGGYTVLEPRGPVISIYDAANTYRQRGVGLLVIAGREYGTGSSRDWAAKGTALLGVRAVLAQSFERIHRANLVQMGVVPLEFKGDQDAESLGLTGFEQYDVEFGADGVRPGGGAMVVARSNTGPEKRFEVRVRIDSVRELEYVKHGGILPFVARRFLEGSEVHSRQE